MLQIKEEAQVENPREYEPGTVEELRHLLQAGSPAKRDPQRENFYEVESKSETYYRPMTSRKANKPMVTWSPWKPVVR